MFSIIFRGSVKIFHVFSIVFQASTSKRHQEKNLGRNHGTRKFDAKYSANDDSPKKQQSSFLYSVL